MFEFFQDKVFFIRLLSRSNDGKLAKNFLDYFDFRSPEIKRKEFSKLRNGAYAYLISRFGKKCMLAISKECSETRNLVIDHFIPLSSNELNKKLRKMKARRNKKVVAQSFGSNNLCNLVLACEKCNSYKKHKLPDKFLVK